MKKITVAITIRNDVPLNQILFGNGLSQNVKFLYDLMQLIGCDPYFLVTNPSPHNAIVFNDTNYKAYTINEAIQTKIKTDLALEAGVTIGHKQRALLRDTFNTKIVAIRYGHSMFMDMEQMCHQETMSPGLYINKPDAIWASPHFIKAFPYFETIYQAPALIGPYIWEPDFVTELQDSTYIEKPDIYVMEPSISLLKNALIPMAIIEKAYRAQPDLFGKAMILNGTHYNQQKYFLENIARNMSSLIADANKVYFTGRYGFDDTFKTRDILLGHQWECELNYLYLEALYKNIPLVHNSPAFAEVGYYYPEFDVNVGHAQLVAAINDKNYDDQKNKDFIYQYSIHNIDNQEEYKRLIEDVL
ncbi:MAG: hypothetical protein ACJA1X_001081 [Bermanella sp.]|jgi:hypothetical protein